MTPDNNSVATPQKPLDEQLVEVHDLLEEQAKDVANAAMLYYVKAIGVEKIIKSMSSLAASISVALVNAKTDKSSNKIDKDDHELMSSYASKLGNAQFEMQGLIGDVNQFNELAKKISSRGTAIAATIAGIQGDFSEVSARISKQMESAEQSN